MNKVMKDALIRRRMHLECAASTRFRCTLFQPRACGPIQVRQHVAWHLLADRAQCARPASGHGDALQWNSLPARKTSC